jgi:uncharacterized membrane protein HdeD (DUF308 family)
MASTQVTQGMPSLSDAPLASILGDNWWLLLLRGIAGILFGVLAFAWPALTLVTLVILWGAFAAADGVLALIAAFSGQGAKVAPRWWLILVGLAGVASGAIAFIWPGVAAEVLLLLIGAWALVVGVSQVIGGIALRKEIQGEWMLILSGLLAIAFGVAIIAWPIAGALAIVWMIGLYALLFGTFLVALSFRVRQLKSAG